MEIKQIADVVNMFKDEKYEESEDVQRLMENGMKFRKLMAYYKCAIMEVETKFRVLNESLAVCCSHNPIETIKSRLKEPKSIADKLNRKGIECNFQNIEKSIDDIAGLRVICAFIDDVYMLSDYLIKQDDITLVEYTDYIKSPKKNGYRSLHVVVSIPIFLGDEKRSMKVEIQFRTMAMDFWAALEHKLSYKSRETCSEEIISELKECANVSATLDEKMQKIKNKVDKHNV